MVQVSSKVTFTRIQNVCKLHLGLTQDMYMQELNLTTKLQQDSINCHTFYCQICKAGGHVWNVCSTQLGYMQMLPWSWALLYYEFWEKLKHEYTGMQRIADSKGHLMIIEVTHHQVLEIPVPTGMLLETWNFDFGVLTLIDICFCMFFTAPWRHWCSLCREKRKSCGKGKEDQQNGENSGISKNSGILF